MRELRLALGYLLLLGPAVHAAPVHPGMEPGWPPRPPRRTEREKDGLVGPVGSVLTARAELVNSAQGLAEGPRCKSRDDFYDPKGNKTVSSLYSTDGSFFGRDEYRYDACRRKVEVSRYGGDETPREQWFYTYGADGNVAVCWYYQDDSYEEKTVYRYDEWGRLVRRDVLGPRGNLKFRNSYRCDLLGNVVEYTFHTEPHLPPGLSDVYLYDEKGILYRRERNQYVAVGALEFKHVWSYEQGNLTEEALVNPDGSVRRKYCYTHEFDEHGNWIKQTKFDSTIKDGKTLLEGVQVTYRQITYFSDDEQSAKGGTDVIESVAVEQQVTVTEGEQARRHGRAAGAARRGRSWSHDAGK